MRELLAADSPILREATPLNPNWDEGRFEMADEFVDGVDGYRAAQRHTKAPISPPSTNMPSRSITACTATRTSATTSAQGRSISCS